MASAERRTPPPAGAGATLLADTDVLVVGNGPAALALSFMLQGHVPFYDTRAGDHPNAALHARLAPQRHSSLLEQDLAALSVGLEGRSASGVALLVDQLHLPNADTDGTQPSRLSWALEKDRRIAHIVVGRGPVGGHWAKMPADTEPVSPATWLELPGLPIADWLRGRPDASNLTPQHRIPARLVAEYYQGYVEHFGLREHFLDGMEVTSLRRISQMQTQGLGACTLLHRLGTKQGARRGRASSFNDSSSTAQVCATGDCQNYGWMLQAVPAVGSRGLPMLIRAKHVVLAGGVFDVPQLLGVPGEHASPRVYHTAGKRADLAPATHTDRPARRTVVVVGSGIAAADAVFGAHAKGCNVVHLFKHRTGTRPLAKLPAEEYPGYARLYGQMRAGKIVVADDSGAYYMPLADAAVEAIVPGTDDEHGPVTVRVLLPVPAGAPASAERHSVTLTDVEAVFVLIGRRPCLGFLPQHLLAATAVGDTQPVPLDRNTFAWPGEPDLYAIGSLAGDKFVRFLWGGAVAVAGDLQLFYRRLQPRADADAEAAPETSANNSAWWPPAALDAHAPDARVPDDAAALSRSAPNHPALVCSCAFQQLWARQPRSAAARDRLALARIVSLPI
eukprot:Unigene9061_Nuclearia_a/m.27715 Unigene9061_Nuclearia_a/g.27715  ORF Unigene9061_Nuclearia_a/g.27715 Unigene9061_Nuclearia_a/m.27715 type:complete len:618 (+) Unigene9061_Nuclearia_a:48-1901(+)